MDSLKKKAARIITNDERSSDSRCLMGLCANLWTCYWTSKFARNVIDEATELLDMENNFDRPVASVDYSECLEVRPIDDFEEFESRVLVSNQIMTALKDPNVNKVGVYGMAGTGKTVLVEKIGADLKLDNTFTYVVLVTVSQKQDQRSNNYQANLSKIQEQISMGFKIQLKGETLKNRATELDKQLQKKDKVLIILDDIWSGFELKDVGIPIGNVHKNFKILMTSRNEALLRKEMNSTSNFGLDILPHPEAWILFDRMVGGHYEYFEWRPTAEQVVKQCGGIPIILVTTGKALRNETLESWEDALTQLENFDGENIVEAYKMLEVNYQFLKSEEKKLFRLCAQLNHRSIPIDNLLKYAMGLNLFKWCKTLKDVRNRLHKYLNDLKGCCLLQNGNEEGTMIKMQDVNHKFASSMALRHHHVFSVANDDELEEWPSKDELEHFSAISLPFCHLPPDHMLPVAFDNPNLKSFIMLRSENDASFKISDNFFAGLKRLKLIHLTWVSLSPVLVSSFGALVKLRTLWLDHCKLIDISVIGELPMLQALSLVGSSIVLVPKEIGNLGGSLKLLDLRDCFELKTIASGVISRLTLLEDLRIGASFSTWQPLEGEDKSNESVDETYEAEVASLKEFKNLHNLINLEIHVAEYAKMFPKDLVFRKLETFRIFIGRLPLYTDRVIPRTLVVDESLSAVDFDCDGIKALMTSAETLLLGGVMGCDDHVLPIGSFENVRVLELDDLPRLLSFKLIEGLPSPTSLFNKKIAFPRLEVLRMSRIKVEKIWDDESAISVEPTCWLQNITTLSLDGCNNVSYLFTSSMVESFAQLKELAVCNCESIKEIVASTEREMTGDIQLSFPRLENLKLDCLPNLQRFCEGSVFECPLLRKLIIQSCSKLKTLVALPNIEELEINDCSSFRIVWGNQLRSNSLSRRALPVAE